MFLHGGLQAGVGIALGIVGEVKGLLLNGRLLSILSCIGGTGVGRRIAAGRQNLGRGLQADGIDARVCIDDDAGRLKTALGNDGIVAIPDGQNRDRIGINPTGIGGIDKGILARAAHADHLRGDVIDRDGQLQRIEDIAEPGFAAVPGIGVAVFRLLGIVAQRKLLLPDVGVQIAFGAHVTEPCQGFSINDKGIEEHGQYQYQAQDPAQIGLPGMKPRQAPFPAFIIKITIHFHNNSPLLSGNFHIDTVLALYTLPFLFYHISKKLSIIWRFVIVSILLRICFNKQAGKSYAASGTDVTEKDKKRTAAKRAAVLFAG